MKLKEVVEKYGSFCNDYELIELYFSLNNIEEQAVEMLANMSKKVIQKQSELENKRLKAIAENNIDTTSNDAK